MTETHDTNGTATRRGKAARRWVEELGPDVTFDQVIGRLRDAGEKEISEGTFAQYKSELYGKRRPPKVHALPTAIPDDRPPLGALERLVKVAALVASVGGIAEARRLLDALERVEGEFARK